MTYQQYDESVQDGDPFHLYLFERGSTVFTYTDLAVEYEALSEVWEPVGLISGKVIRDRDFQKSTISIQFPRTNALANSFLFGDLEDRTSVTIYRGYRSDPDQEVIVYWKGRVSGTKTSGQIVTIDCEPILNALRQPGLRSRYTRNCRYALYRRGCNLNQEDFAVAAEATAINGAVITVTEAALQADGWYTGGMIKAQDGVLKFIRLHVGDQLTLMSVYDGLVESSGQDIFIYPGCDRLLSTCRDKFDNLNNYGGVPYIPTENPFVGSIV